MFKKDLAQFVFKSFECGRVFVNRFNDACHKVKTNSGGKAEIAQCVQDCVFHEKHSLKKYLKNNPFCQW